MSGRRKQKSSGGGGIVDERFAEIKWHPKYRRIPRQVRKVKIDKRFESMFDDPNFKLKQVVDKRGRPLGKTSSEDLRRFYEISSSESEKSDDDDDGTEEIKKTIDKRHRRDISEQIDGDRSEKSESDDDEDQNIVDEQEDEEKIDEDKSADGKSDESESESDDEESDESDQEASEDEKIKFDLARGEGNISSSSEDSSSEWEFEEDAEAGPLHDWDDMDANRAPAIEQSTSRLAICNMDWDKITARDLLILLNSFKPTSGDIRSIRIYPSDFGLQRMNEEQKSGPIELREAKSEFQDDDDEDDREKSCDESEDEGPGGSSFLDKAQEERRQKILLEKLRQYEFNRLKYYYAVAECDSIETAEHIYSQCDNMEYETSGTRLDLRFIPDSTQFDDRQPKDEATSYGDLSTYRPTTFINKALQQSRPTLSWEEERDQKRTELTKRAFENPNDWDRMELNGMLASPSSSEAEDKDKDGDEEETKNVVEEKTMKTGKKKSILLDSLKKLGGDSSKSLVKNEDEDDDVEMEIKWDTGVEEKMEQQQQAEKANQADDDKKKTQWEKFLDRRKEKRRQRKEDIRQKRLAVKRQRQGLASDEEEDGEFPSDFEDEPRRKPKKHQKKKGKFGKSADGDSDEKDEEDAEEKKKRDAQLALLLDDEDENSKHRHYDLKKLLKSDKIKSKSTTDEREESDFTMKMDDPRFKAVFDSHLYNIDPSDPAFKKTPGMKQLVDVKQKTKGVGDRSKNGSKIGGQGSDEHRGKIVEESDDRRVKNGGSGGRSIKSGDQSSRKASDGKSTASNPELSLLAKKVKAKTDMLRKEKERRKLKQTRP